MRGELLFLLKVSRPGFWMTSIWFYLLPGGGATLEKTGVAAGYDSFHYA